MDAIGRKVFITGATGYLGRCLAPRLIARGHLVRALVRPTSQSKAPAGCEIAMGDPLRKETFTQCVRNMDIFVQLVGVPHPSPAKARQFREVDLVSARESIAAAVSAGVKHFIYVSVAHPAPVMKEYIAVRIEVERLLRESGLPATILRPWYVLGPGHRWAHAMAPFYWMAERIPAWREGAQRLGLVTLEQMIRALSQAVETEPDDVRVWGVPEIRRESASKDQPRSLRLACSLA